VITTCPWVGWVTELIEAAAPPSTSVSLASTSTAVAGSSSTTLLPSRTASGRSSTQLTVTETVPIDPPFRV
jgi:hypothetical protein